VTLLTRYLPAKIETSWVVSRGVDMAHVGLRLGGRSGQLVIGTMKIGIYWEHVAHVREHLPIL
jgi:hypothetical protein